MIVGIILLTVVVASIGGYIARFYKEQWTVKLTSE